MSLASRQSLAELAEGVNAWARQHGVRPASGQSADELSERNLRFYRTVGLLDGPQEGGGYGPKHRSQLVAIRLLQAQGLPLRRIRDLLLGRSEADLREIERRGLDALPRGAVLPNLPAAGNPGGVHWWTAALTDDLLLVSLRGRPVGPATLDALRQAIYQNSNHDHPLEDVNMPHPRSTPARLAAGKGQDTSHGLLAWLEETRIRLPLKGVEVQFDICGDLVNVEIDQVWHQDNALPAHCLYIFPLPAGAAVYRCELHVNGRLLVAKVEELHEARRIAQEKKAAGHRTALVEQVRDNVFELALGNLAPGDVAVIRLAYVQVLDRNRHDASLRIPMCPGVRYIAGQPLLRDNQGRGTADDTNQVPDASRISPPRIDSLHPDAAYVAIEGTIADPSEVVADLVSPSHALLTRDETGLKRVFLAQRDAVADRDFVVRWTESGSDRLQSSAWSDGAGHYLLRLVAPDAIAATQRSQDVYFLLDQSGSMQGDSWEKACAALREFPGQLGEVDRVWVTLFETGHRDFAEEPLLATKLAGMRSWKDLVEVGTQGGTELLPALEHVLGAVARHSKGRSATLVIITDGQVGNEAEIEAALSAQPDLRLHVLLIGVSPNDDFARRLTRQQRGTFVAAAPADDIPAIVKRLAVRLRQPVVTDLVLDDGWQPAGTRLPDLHAGETLSVALHGPTTGAESRAIEVHDIRLQGRDGSGANWTATVALQSPTVPSVGVLWARERIAWLETTGHDDEAVALAREHNLLCRGTAFVAWDPTEKVIADSALDLYQPVLADSAVPFPDSKIQYMRSFAGGLRAASASGGRFSGLGPIASPALPRRDSTLIERLANRLRKRAEQRAMAKLARRRLELSMAELEALLDRCQRELARLETTLSPGGKPSRGNGVEDLNCMVHAMQKDLVNGEFVVLPGRIRAALTKRSVEELDVISEELGRVIETLRELLTRLEGCNERPGASGVLPDWADRLLQVPDSLRERLRRDPRVAAAMDRLEQRARPARPKAKA